MLEKQCKRCFCTRPLDAFNRAAWSADGHNTICKMCRSEERKTPEHKARKRASYLRNRDKVIAKSRAYYAANREHCKARQRAYNAAHADVIRKKNRAAYAALTAEERATRRALYYNPQRQRLYNKRYRLANLDRLRLADATYRFTHRAERNAYERRHRVTTPEWEKSKRHTRRARLAAGGTFSPCEWVALCDGYGNVCLACRSGGVKLTPDHIVPLCDGGANTIDNIQPLCLRCNLRKGRKHTDYRPGYSNSIRCAGANSSPSASSSSAIVDSQLHEN